MHMRTGLRIFATIALAFFLAAPACAQSGISRTTPKDVKLRPTFILSFYHFNIQYVVGDNQAKTRIVRQGLEPLLDMYLHHPDWGCDIGMQALTLDFLDAFFPDVLAKLRTLVERGQVEIVSSNYSHTLTLAYPRHDWDWSDRMAADVFKRLDLPRAPVAFLHEGQFGWGLTSIMEQSGATAALAPASAIERFHGPDILSPLYDTGKGYVLPAGAAFATAWFSVQWNYFDYGEAALTKPSSPTDPAYAFNYQTASAHEQRLLELSAQEGARVARISDYVDYILNSPYIVPVMPPVPDSNWGATASDDFFLWMGWYASPMEKDFRILSSAYAARNELVLAETMIAFAKEQGHETRPEESLLFDAWGALLRGEAAGGTGWHPSGDEVAFTLDVIHQAHETAVNIIRSLKIKLDMPTVDIDAFAGTVRRSLAADPDPPLTTCPIDPVITGAAPGYTVSCYKVSDSEIRILMAVAPARWGLSLLRVAFPLLGSRLQFSPGLREFSLADYQVSDFKTSRYVLPLSNGLVGLGDGTTFLITHNDTSHIAAHLDTADNTLSFMINNAPAQVFTLKFTLFKGEPQAALDRANSINTLPRGLR